MKKIIALFMSAAMAGTLMVAPAFANADAAKKDTKTCEPAPVANPDKTKDACEPKPVKMKHKKKKKVVKKAAKPKAAETKAAEPSAGEAK